MRSGGVHLRARAAASARVRAQAHAHAHEIPSSRAVTRRRAVAVSHRPGSADQRQRARRRHPPAIDLVCAPSAIELTISDDGRGSTDPDRGFGLLGVRERIEVATRPGAGFRLHVELPG